MRARPDQATISFGAEQLAVSGRGSVNRSNACAVWLGVGGGHCASRPQSVLTVCVTGCRAAVGEHGLERRALAGGGWQLFAGLCECLRRAGSVGELAGLGAVGAGGRGRRPTVVRLRFGAA